MARKVPIRSGEVRRGRPRTTSGAVLGSGPPTGSLARNQYPWPELGIRVRRASPSPLTINLEETRTPAHLSLGLDDHQ